jgi:hypothetical protein
VIRGCDCVPGLLQINFCVELHFDWSAHWLSTSLNRVNPPGSWRHAKAGDANAAAAADRLFGGPVRALCYTPSRTVANDPAAARVREVSAGVEEFLPNDRWPSATIRAFEKRAPS